MGEDGKRKNAFTFPCVCNLKTDKLGIKKIKTLTLLMLILITKIQKGSSAYKLVNKFLMPFPLHRPNSLSGIITYAIRILIHFIRGGMQVYLFLPNRHEIRKCLKNAHLAAFLPGSKSNLIECTKGE